MIWEEFIMEHKTNTFLQEEPVGKLMQRYAVPCIFPCG